MKRPVLLGTLLAALLAPLASAQAYNGVSISVNTPEFGVRIGSPLYRRMPVYVSPPLVVPVPVYAPAMYAPEPVYVPVHAYAPQPFYAPARIYAAAPAYYPGPIVVARPRVIVPAPVVVAGAWPYAGVRVASRPYERHWKHKHEKRRGYERDDRHEHGTHHRAGYGF